MISYLRAPLINVNDEVMTLVEWVKQAGDVVRPGEILAVIETTKSTAEIEAEGEGYLHPLVEAGAEIRVGQAIAALKVRADDPVEPVEDRPAQATGSTVPAASADVQPGPAGSRNRRWTKKAELLARRQGLDIADLDIEPGQGDRIGEADLLAYLERTSREQRPVREDLVDGPFAENRQERVLVIGAGGAGVQILDVLSRLANQRAVGLLDDNPDLHGKTVMGVPVLGPIEQAGDFFEQGLFDGAVISIGTRISLREQIFARLKAAGVPFANVIAPSAQLRSNVSMGSGNAIMPLAQVGACTTMGDNNFLSSFVNLEHHNRLGDHCTFGPGVMTSGQVGIGDRVKFGAGVFVEPLIEIGSDSVVASGVVLTRSVPPNSLVKTRSNFVVRPRPQGS